MKYLIKSSGKLKRKRWFTNQEFGISIRYQWLTHLGEVTFDSAFLDEDCQEELDNFIDPLLIDLENDNDPEEIWINYPAPWFFLNPEQASKWDLPPYEKELSFDFRISMSANYIGDKAQELDDKNLPGRWTTNDEMFKWDVDNIKPALIQRCPEYQMMAKLWESKAWSSQTGLDEFMLKEFGMSIEDDDVIFSSPRMYTSP